MLAAVMITGFIFFLVLVIALTVTGKHPDQVRAQRRAQMTPEQRQRETEEYRRRGMSPVDKMIGDYQYAKYAARRQQAERHRAKYEQVSGEKWPV